ncbi:MAG: hypothetical protein WDM81_10185 [Rhizomicrobium sp.]
MALFYLNIRHGEALARIPNTVQFRSADEARDNAIVSMRALLAMGPSDGDFHSQQIEVADAGTNHPVAVGQLLRRRAGARPARRGNLQIRAQGLNGRVPSILNPHVLY